MGCYMSTWNATILPGIKVQATTPLTSKAWFQIFPDAKLENLATPAYCHHHILLDHYPIVRPCRTRRAFKFENAWCVEPGLNDVVHAKL